MDGIESNKDIPDIKNLHINDEISDTRQLAFPLALARLFFDPETEVFPNPGTEKAAREKNINYWVSKLLSLLFQ